jgi:putative hydrolase of the HAD superfamily
MVEVAADFLKRALGSRPPVDLVARFVETYIAEWNKGVRYPSGLREFLERLSLRYALGIITNTHHASLVRDHLNQIGVSDVFRVVVTSVEHGWRKPHPEIFLHTLRSLGARADQSVYVGDSYEADYLGSRAVGMTPLLIDPDRRSSIPESSRLDALFQLEQRLQDTH